MKKFLAVTLVLICATSMSLNAGQAKNQAHKKRAAKAELLSKYDTNKDGKISKAERASMSKHDKKLARRSGLRHKHAEKNKLNK